jgi:benzoate-CoA ligase family protein
MRAADLPQLYNAVEILERNLPARAGKIALECGDHTRTFGQASREVNQVGRALLAEGVRIGEVVALLAFDGPCWVATYFGTMKVGGVVASLNTLLTPREYAYMLNDSRARVLVVEEALLPKIREIRSELRFLEKIVVIGAGSEDVIAYSAWIADRPTELETAPTHRDDFCCLNYSSGTTGEPKGILHAHKDLRLTAELVGQRLLGIREDDKTFAVAKLFFTFGTGGNLIFPWYAGASIVLHAGSPRIATDVLDVLSRYKPTVFFTAPTSYASILAVPELTKRWSLKSIRLCVSAGEALPAPIWEAWKAATGLEIIDGIGSTENYHIFLSNRPGDVRPGSSGRPIDGYELKIVDERGQEVPRGEVGTLWVKGETAALFYLHQHARSQRTFLGPWLDTGDKYVQDEEGYFWHAGRSDDMLKVGGIWVSPVEVESAVIGHPAVLECAVIGKADASGLVKPLAFVVLKDGVPADEKLAEALIAYSAEKMAPYKRPRWIEFVKELPKTATGKIQRFRLRAGD